MFKKKKKKEEVVESVLVDEETLDVSSMDIAEVLNKTDDLNSADKSVVEEPVVEEPVVEEPKGTSSIGDFFKKKKLEPEPLESESFDATSPFIWTDSPEAAENIAKENKKKKRGRKSKKGKDEVVEEPIEGKKELNTFFEDGKSKSKKLKKKDKKEETSKSNKKGRKKSRKQRNMEDIKDQKVFRYNGKRYSKVEDFITYLNEHYLDIEEISAEVLTDENFFGWINKNSGIFDASLKEYQEIKAKIENKS